MLTQHLISTRWCRICLRWRWIQTQPVPMVCQTQLLSQRCSVSSNQALVWRALRIKLNSRSNWRTWRKCSVIWWVKLMRKRKRWMHNRLKRRKPACQNPKKRRKKRKKKQKRRCLRTLSIWTLSSATLTKCLRPSRKFLNNKKVKARSKMILQLTHSLSFCLALLGVRNLVLTAIWVNRMLKWWTWWKDFWVA